MNLIPIARFPLTTNLSALSRALHENNVLHRFTEERNQQILWVDESYDKNQIDQAVRQFSNQQLSNSQAPSVPAEPLNSEKKKLSYLDQALLICHKIPLTVSIIVLGIIGFFLTQWFNPSYLLSKLYFSTIDRQMATGEYWRTLTPIFIHFGYSHILFNSLWIVILGLRIEPYLKFNGYFVLVFLTGVSGNILQYALGDSYYFGGLSGVLFGMFGFLWVANRIYKIPVLFFPASVIGFIFAFLIIGFTGVFKTLFNVSIANWAHLGGFFAGIVCGFIFLNSERPPDDKEN